jgi:hypothetical protein
MWPWNERYLYKCIYSCTAVCDFFVETIVSILDASAPQQGCWMRIYLSAHASTELVASGRSETHPKILVEKLERKRPRGRPSFWREHNIVMDIKGT